MAKRLILVVAGVVWAAAAMSAAVPSFWQVSALNDFLRGEVENLSIDSHSRLGLGPASSTLYEATAPFLWTAVASPDGMVYVGTGNDGRVLRIDAAGKGSVFFSADELEIHALALAPSGVLYVGSSPDGKIYRVEPSGKSTVFFDPDDKYIWSLAVDKAGNVFAATGEKGVVYKITPEGKGAPFYQTKATHAMALAFDRQGRLLIGTESPGRVFQVDASGRPFVLLDSPFNEIHSLRVAPDGTIYAAAITGKTSARGSSSATVPVPEPINQPVTVPTVSAEITSITVVADVSATAPSAAASPHTPAASGVGGVYRILPDGEWDLVWESNEDTPYDIAIDGDGSLFVATGNKGKIFKLAGDPMEPMLVARANAQQVTSILRDHAGATIYATSNPGKLLRLSAARADKGTYESDVRDAQTTATWGTIKWHSTIPPGARVEIATRSGNTKTPDETWSPWSPAYANADGTPIVSPHARYLQWKATLVGAHNDSPLLTSVTVAYLQRNLRPRVLSITVHPPGTVFQKPYPTGDPDIAGFDAEPPDRRALAQSPTPGSPLPSAGPVLGRRAYQKGLMTFVWRADDDNGDELQYDVLYRREGETSWKTLKKGLSDQILVWDTTSVPNGTYVVRVVASDAPSNSAATALTGHLDSVTFDIDNTPPVIHIRSVRREGARTVVAFDVRDEDSFVQKVEYSLDGARWLAVYPKDGIADSRFEEFELALEGDATTHGVVIRAADALNNVATASTQSK
jgi:sugar lactone lactonase YvrE